VARKPKCWNCLIADLCEFKDKTPAPAGVLDPAAVAAATTAEAAIPAAS